MISNELLQKNQGLVHKLAKRYFCSTSDYNDLVQAGNIGLIEAEKHFDPSKNTSFFTFAFFWVRKRIKEEVAKSHTVRVPAHVQEKRNKQESPEVCVTYSMESCVANLAEKSHESFRIHVESAYIQRLISKLPEQERDVVYYRLKGFTLAEIGERIGMTGQGVNLIEKKAVKKLRNLKNFV